MPLSLIVDSVNLILISASAAFYPLTIASLHPLNPYSLSVP